MYKIMIRNDHVLPIVASDGSKEMTEIKSFDRHLRLDDKCSEPRRLD